MAFPPNFKPGAKGKPPMAKSKPGAKGKKPMPPGMKGKGKPAPSTPLDSETLGTMAQSLKGMSGAR